MQDLPSVTAIEAGPRTNTFRPGGPPSPTDVAEQLLGYVAAWQEGGLGYWLVEHAGQPVAGHHPEEHRPAAVRSLLGRP